MILVGLASLLDYTLRSLFLKENESSIDSKLSSLILSWQTSQSESWFVLCELMATMLLMTPVAHLIYSDCSLRVSLCIFVTLKMGLMFLLLLLFSFLGALTTEDPITCWTYSCRFSASNCIFWVFRCFVA